MKNFKLFTYILLGSIFFMACAEQKPAAQDSAEETQAPETPEAPKPAFVDLNLESFKQKMNDPDIVILDVRTPGETAEGMIEGAIEADIRNPEIFNNAMQSLDKEKTYLVYCRSGARSVEACKALHEQGFTNLYNLLGGYNAWSGQ